MRSFCYNFPISQLVSTLVAKHPNGDWWQRAYFISPACRQSSKWWLAVKGLSVFGDAHFPFQLCSAMSIFLFNSFRPCPLFFGIDFFVGYAVLYSATTHVYVSCVFQFLFFPTLVSQSLKCDWWWGVCSYVCIANYFRQPLWIFFKCALIVTNQ